MSQSQDLKLATQSTKSVSLCLILWKLIGLLSKGFSGISKVHFSMACICPLTLPCNLQHSKYTMMQTGPLILMTEEVHQGQQPILVATCCPGGQRNKLLLPGLVQRQSTEVLLRPQLISSGYIPCYMNSAFLLSTLWFFVIINQL